MGRKRVEIIIETERILLVSRAGGNPIQWCERCDRHVPALTLEEAAALTNADPDELFRKLEEQQFHRIRAAGGRTLVCLNSLLD